MGLFTIEPLNITLDHPQTRIKRDRLATLLDGKTWGKSFRQNAWVDPITGTGMLMPAPLDPQFSQVSSGRFARLRKSDYLLATPSQWVEFDRGRCPGDYYLHALSTNEAVYTNEAYAVNRGQYISVYNYSVGNETKRIILRCGWFPIANWPSKPELEFAFYSNGEVDVFRNTVFEQTHILRGKDDGKNPWSAQGGETANRTVDIIILPFRRREVLVVTNQGAGFSHVIQGIAEDDDDPIIHSVARFGWQVEEGKATVQSAPLRFPESGYLTSVHTVFRDPPLSGEVPQFLEYADLYPGTNIESSLVMRGNPTVPFVPDGERRECRIKVDMTGGGDFTPNLYGVQASFPPILTTTSDEPVEVVTPGFVMAARLDVPASPKDAGMQIDVNRPDELEFGMSDVSLLKDIENRPVLISLGNLPIMDAWGETPSFVLGQREDDRLSRFILRLRDSWQRMEEYVFSDPTPLDGLNLASAFDFLAKTAGFLDSELDIDSIDFNLPTGGTTYEGEFVTLIRPGQRASDVWDKLHQTYCPLFFYGVCPTATGPVLKLKDNETMPTAPDVTLYSTVEEAMNNLSGDPSEWDDPSYRRDFAARVFRSYREESVALETNEIWVQGFDQRERKPILCRVQNRESKDPELPKNMRPKTWLGAPRKYSWTDPSLTTQTALRRAARVLCKRLFPRRYFVEWQSEFLLKDDGIPIWRGDVVELFGKRTVRVISLSGEFRKEPIHDTWRSRPFRYLGEVIGGSES